MLYFTLVYYVNQPLPKHVVRGILTKSQKSYVQLFTFIQRGLLPLAK